MVSFVLDQSGSHALLLLLFLLHDQTMGPHTDCGSLDTVPLPSLSFSVCLPLFLCACASLTLTRLSSGERSFIHKSRCPGVTKLSSITRLTKSRGRLGQQYPSATDTEKSRRFSTARRSFMAQGPSTARCFHATKNSFACTNTNININNK